MPTILTHNLRPHEQLPESHAVYCGLDCCLTLEIYEALSRLSNQEPAIYNFERALQAPALDMMMRGFRIDDYERQKGMRNLRAHIAKLDNWLQEMSHAVWGRPVNPRSGDQLKALFYGAMHLPEIWTSKKGERKMPMDRETLEKLENYLYARPIIATILTIRETGKKLEVLETEIDPDGRMRSGYNIAGTETGRWSESASSLGTGRNRQNIDPTLRLMFVADEDWKICGIDLEQAESREVGLQHGINFGDWRYLDACEAGDLHTGTSRLIWPQMSWTGDLKRDRELADNHEVPFYREFTHRDMAKRGGHGCLTEDHEVLTRNGWVSITEKPEEILCWNSSHISYFDKVQSWTDELYTGTMHFFNGNSISAVMTSRHRIPFTPDQRYPIREKLAKDGPGQYMPLGDGYIGGNITVPAKLIAAFMSDGHQKTLNRMEFHFHKERKKERLIKLCQEYSFQYEIRGNKILVHGELPKKCSERMFNWTKECIYDFVTEYKFWDGSQQGKNICLSCKDKSQLEWIQTFGRILGIGGTIDKPHLSGFGSIIWRLRQNNRKYATGASIQHIKIETKNCRVLCPTVISSWFYVRRKGKIYVTGNTSYMGTPFTMARHLKVPVKLMENFQHAFFSAYPAFQKSFAWVATEIQTKGYLTTPFGRTRHFFGRTNDDTTLREAVAYTPQSSTADRLNLALWRIWRYMPDVQLLAQVHDAIYFQYRDLGGDYESDIIRRALGYISTPLTAKQIPELKSRIFDVPGEAQVGWNWGKQSIDKITGEIKNADGLIKWKGKDNRKRTPILKHIL